MVTYSYTAVYRYNDKMKKKVLDHVAMLREQHDTYVFTILRSTDNMLLLDIEHLLCKAIQFHDIRKVVGLDGVYVRLYSNYLKPASQTNVTSTTKEDAPLHGTTEPRGAKRRRVTITPKLHVWTV